MQKLLVTVAAIAAFAQVAPPALAYPRGAPPPYPQWVTVIRDCANDGKLNGVTVDGRVGDGTYRTPDLLKALHNVPTDGGEYSDCTNEIQRALDGGSGKDYGPPPNGILTPSGAVAASPEDVAQLQSVIDAASAGEPPSAAGAQPRSAQAAQSASEPEAVLGGLDRSSAPAYHVDVGLLAAVLGAALPLLAAASAVRRLRGRRAV
jgi:hypothetical protein